MAVCDSDGDGTLNITEFERSLKVVEMRRAFMAIDKDGSGQINISELHELAAAVHTCYTSGGVLMHGNHVLFRWSVTQPVQALSG